ncbi:sigma-E factor negative regulatory protein [Endozoicomonas sp. 8E]|uniref:sigma-E factor negative regulatory protein n=1 Tax=Endozoicomonas sp. 8E TaxID=3035692 RepID=UPI0029390007|nr:sigma-E factor negative regulatory protein [Endozoicomonas sp. 8E]WOG25569.1 sigma-E factor negative regulatory protein [Endozoicomonas sp. 8E]
MSEKTPHNHARERLNESLSAAMDGEAGEFELRRVLDNIGSDEHLRGKARRYQIAGDVLRRESNEFMDIDLSAGIRDRLEAEPSHSVAKERSVTGHGVLKGVGHWWSKAGRVAVAASVALAVLLGVKNYNTSPETLPLVTSVTDQTTLLQPVQIMHNGYGAAGIQAGYNSRQHDSITPEQLAQAQRVADRAIKERFRAYALQHAEMSAMNSGQGILPFARLTTFESQ